MPEPAPELPLSVVSGALHDIRRVLADAGWRIVDLMAAGDTVSLRIRFTSADTAAPTATLCREGDYWSLDWAGTVLRLRHSRGLGHLYQLLSHPDVELHVLQVLDAERPAPPTGSRGVPPELSVGGWDDLGPRLDDTARRAYRGRLADLREEEADAEACHDLERAARARTEIDALTRQLAQAFGLGGRPRGVGSATERARINVTRALRSAIRRIGRAFPDLGHHLDTTVHTGVFCRYQPGPNPPVTWLSRR